jgi:hypothetical protein
MLLIAWRQTTVETQNPHSCAFCDISVRRHKQTAECDDHVGSTLPVLWLHLWQVPSGVFLETKLFRICHIQITTKWGLFGTNNLLLANAIYTEWDSCNGAPQSCCVCCACDCVLWRTNCLVLCRKRGLCNWHAKCQHIVVATENIACRHSCLRKT